MENSAGEDKRAGWGDESGVTDDSRTRWRPPCPATFATAGWQFRIRLGATQSTNCLFVQALRAASAMRRLPQVTRPEQSLGWHVRPSCNAHGERAS